jgi:hypothetical protein
MRVVSILVAALVLTACQTPAINRTQIEDEAIRREGLLQEAATLRMHSEHLGRLRALSQPLLVAAAELCGGLVRPSTGVYLASLGDYSDRLQPAAVEAFGATFRPFIQHAPPDGPAFKAGLREGDRIVSFAGVPAGAHEAALYDLLNELDAIEAEPGVPVPITVQRGDQTLTVDVAPVVACDYGLVMQQDSQINAFADGENIIFTPGIMRLMDDRELRTIIGHELAHNILDHVNKSATNATIAAIPGFALDIMAALAGVNTQGYFTNTGAGLGLAAYSQEFEAEADIVGLYIVAMAGYPLEEPAELWRRMAAANGGATIYLGTSHPPSAERAIVLDRIARQIDGKIASGEKLWPPLPEDWQPRDREPEPLQVSTPPQGGGDR